MTLSVSVALGTYNSARYIEPQLTSIFGQDSTIDELVVSDDGSTDGTVDLVRRIFEHGSARSTKLVLLRSRERQGVTRNFEKAVSATTSELVVLSDHDDVWHPDRVSKAIHAFESDEELLLQHSNARLVDANGSPLGISLFDALGVTEAERKSISDDRAFDAYIRRNLATGATVTFRRSVLDAALPFPPEWVHDEWLAIIASAIGRTALLDDPLLDYRQHGNNAIGVVSPTVRYKIKRMFEARSGRYRELSLRADVLVERLLTLGVGGTRLRLAEKKARFERVRSNYPIRRVRRLTPIVREYRNRSYAQLSSQGNLDVVRDLLQPA